MAPILATGRSWQKTAQPRLVVVELRRVGRGRGAICPSIEKRPGKSHRRWSGAKLPPDQPTEQLHNKMSVYRIRIEEIKRLVNPLDGAMWKCRRITPDEVKAAMTAGATENRVWDDLVNTLGRDEALAFHINRVATLARDVPVFDKIIIGLENHKTPIAAWLNDGNHRLAAAYVRGDHHIDAVIAASDPASIHHALPSATLLS